MAVEHSGRIKRLTATVAVAVGGMLVGCGDDGEPAENHVQCGPGTEERGGVCLPIETEGGVDVFLADSQLAEADAISEAMPPEPPCAKSGRCPTTPMVTIDRPSEFGGPFQIDPYETTIPEYEEFLHDVRNGLVPQQTEAACNWNSTYERDEKCIFGLGPDLCGLDPKPYVTSVYCVDQCDATAYCGWAGKRLCSDSEPSQMPPALWSSEVYSACSNGGTEPNPNYGAEWSTCGLCNAPCPDAHPGVFGLSTGFYDMTSHCRTVEHPPNDPVWACTAIGGSDSPTCSQRTLADAKSAATATIRCCK